MLYTIPASYLIVVLDKNISKKQAELNEMQYRSKVSWHSILDPCENWDSIRDCCILILDSRFLQGSSNQNGLCLQTIIKGFCFE